MRFRVTSNVAAPPAPDEQEAHDALPLIGALADQCLPDFADESFVNSSGCWRKVIR
jgi:hypothetical protein